MGYNAYLNDDAALKMKLVQVIVSIKSRQGNSSSLTNKMLNGTEILWMSYHTRP